MRSKLWMVISGIVSGVVFSSMLSTIAVGEPPAPRPLGGGDKTASKVLEYAKSQVGKRVGAGRAMDFVKAALAAAGADPGNPAAENFPVWGERKSSVLLMPGQIIQFEQCIFKSPDGKLTWRFAHHSAIVKNMVANKEGSKNRKVILIHQGEEREYHKAVVHETELDLSWHKEGEWRNYAALPAKSKPLNAPVTAGAPAKPSPVRPTSKPPAQPTASQHIICVPVDWVQVNLDAGLDWFGRDVPGMRESPETKDSLTAMLKKHGFETQHRRVEGKGGSVKLQLFARLTKETRTPNTSGTERLERELKAIAEMVYGGQKWVGRKVYLAK